MFVWMYCVKISKEFTTDKSCSSDAIPLCSASTSVRSRKKYFTPLLKIPHMCVKKYDFCQESPKHLSE